MAEPITGPPPYEKGEDSSLEKGGTHDYVVQSPLHSSDNHYKLDARDLDRVQRRLKQRHVQMIAIAGTLGTGLFLGSGEALSGAGPLGALVAYMLVGTTAYSSLCAVGEMTSFAPISGTFPHFAGRWVDPAFGFATGWNYFYTNAISTPVEITAATILLTFWDPNTKHQAGYTAVICFCVCLINIFGVRYFGESEFMFSMIKIFLILLLIITGLVVDLGGGPDHQRIGFRYWKNPGPVAGAGLEPKHPPLDRFLGILSVIIQAAFSFQGMELVAVAASETESPRRNIAKAVRRVFWRILVFYILGVLITGMLVPFNDPLLLSSGAGSSTADSPYVIAFTRAGIKVLPHIINACIFTSAFSAGNSFLFCSSRILYGLALRGQAPKIFTYCTKNGLPIVAVLATSCFTLLAFMNTSSGATTVFNWFVNLSTVGGFFGWWSINITFLFFYYGLRYQGYNRKEIVYHSNLQPYLSIWGIFWLSLFILINGFEVFWKFNASSFLTHYIGVPIFFGLYFFWKIFKRTKFWKLSEMDFVTAIPSLEETEMPEVPPVTIPQKIAAILF
ncbi:general amino acid permease 1 [Obba rivulosa]|uniref:General amino acid permease 1 n=1 Tax=Obba rivulosa TaxID=1052685 RepID=A0A8E2DV97_9APHY|nr:general amino acid permease 1 [Obba rivulosa]